MRNELVRLTTQDVNKAVPITDSLIVSREINYEHFQVTRLIKKHIDDFCEFGAINFESHLLNSKKVDVAILNESHFLFLITMLRARKKDEKVIWLKKEMVRQFVFLRAELQARIQTRSISKCSRLSLTDSIKKNVDDGTTFKSFAYSNYSKLVYKKVLGMQVAKAKELRGLKTVDNLRDFMTNEELEKVQELESKIAGYIEMRKDLTNDDKLIYEEVKKYVDSITK